LSSIVEIKAIYQTDPNAHIQKNKRRKGDGGAGDKNGLTKYTTGKESK
jgi:hypothetical protein